MPFEVDGGVVFLTYPLLESFIIPNLPELVYEEVKASSDKEAGQPD